MTFNEYGEPIGNQTVNTILNFIVAIFCAPFRTRRKRHTKINILEERIDQMAIAIDRLNATAAALTAAVDGLIAAQANVTPDTQVSALVTTVDAQTAKLVAATPVPAAN